MLAPTRELALQIKEECDKFGASSEIKNTVVYGGVPKRAQIDVLRSGCEVMRGDCKVTVRFFAEWLRGFGGVVR